MRKLALTLTLILVACGLVGTTAQQATAVLPDVAPGLVYQLSGYTRGAIDEVTAQPAGTVVIDLKRSAAKDYWKTDEIKLVKAPGRRVLAHIEIGAIEQFRPEWSVVRDAGLTIPMPTGWDTKRFGKFWDEGWWGTVVKSRVARAAAMGFDGVYLAETDVYSQIPDADLAANGMTRAQAKEAMKALVERTAAYLKTVRPMQLFVEGAPELGADPAYRAVVDGIGMVGLFYSEKGWCSTEGCQDRLLDTLTYFRDQGKVVLAVDTTSNPRWRAIACTNYRGYRLTGVVTRSSFDTVSKQC